MRLHIAFCTRTHAYTQNEERKTDDDNREILVGTEQKKKIQNKTRKHHENVVCLWYFYSHILRPKELPDQENE